MDRRVMGKLGVSVPLLGFGAMRLPLTKEETIDWPAAREMVDEAMASGVNYFDTSSVYHKGESEVFLGKALASYPRDSFYFANKMPI